MMTRTLVLAAALLVGCSGSDGGTAGNSLGGHAGSGGSGGASGSGGTAGDAGGWPTGGAGGASGSGGTSGTGGASGSAGSAGAGAGGSGGSAGASGNPCDGKIGQQCGSALGLDASKLYACNDGTATEIQTCNGTCIARGDGSDTCPCPNGNGTFCGGHGITGDSDKLYKCQDGQVTLDSECGGTCDTGSPDHCSACPSGNGAYCGGDSIKGDTSTLYNCNNGILTVIQKCPVSCQVKPAGTADTCGSCPSGNGAYCGSEVGADPNTLYNCTDGSLSVVQACPSACHVSSPGVADYCEGGGNLTCGNLQWWNSAVTYEWQLQNGSHYWYDTDLAVAAGTPVELRHDSRLEAAPVKAWGWQPQFTDLQTGQLFQFLHMQPGAQYTTSVGTTYKAGTVVGLSGGNTADTGYPQYSSGSHLCVETLVPFTQAFPKGQDACQ